MIGKEVKKTILLMIFAGASIVSTTAMATNYKMYNTSINIYATSAKESTAHLIGVENHMLNGAPHPTCGTKAYILMTDTQLFSTALAVALSGKKVNVVYEDLAEQKVAQHHALTTCKVRGIWWELD